MTIWDEKHIKALLSLRRHPLALVQVEPWHLWLTARGGVRRVLDYLRDAPFSAPQKQLLDLILAHPDASTVFYAGKLHLGQSAYFMRLADLVSAACEYLNAWELVRPHNLPAPLTPLVGAEETIDNVVRILQRPSVRLLTLMGPGGVGKTRLAIAAGSGLLETFRDGVFFISLETLTDPTLLPSQIARSLQIEASGAKPLVEALKAWLQERQILLILDNFEQLIEAAGFVVELLKAAAQLKVLVTSREALNQYGEHRFVVPELSRPDPGQPTTLDQLEAWPAVSLFVQRVQALHPLFVLTEANRESVVRLCDQLDGLPLAIELAAAQVKLLDPEQALPPLERGLKSLRDVARNRPQRQKTLWDAIHWSYRLLPEDEKTLFRQLAVFGRSWSLEAAQQVCQVADAESGLDELANKSLVRRVSETRFQMLQAVREYALDELRESGETETVQHRHADYYVRFAQQAEQYIGTSELPVWMERVRQEHENFRIALQWLLDHQQTDAAFALLGAVWRFWDMLNTWSEAHLWLDRALAQGASLRSVVHAKALWGASWLAAHQGDYTRARALAAEGLALARANNEAYLTARLLQNMADGHFRLGENEQAIACIEESLDILRPLNDREEMAWALDHLARGLRQRGERARSREILQESLSIFREMGHAWAIAYSLSHLGRLALEDDDNDIAAELLTESLALSKLIGGKQRISEILRQLAVLAWRRGDLDGTKSMLAESLALCREVGDRTGEGWGLNWLGRLALEQADFPTARQLLERTQQLFDEVGEPAAIAYNLDCLRRLEIAEKERE